ncbi:hypothetical protein, partial [Escherichia coli]|uniref:hypothetical protein n=1 Tax=Escherichia coli TaxID=562 RepID=UPI0002AAC927
TGDFEWLKSSTIAIAVITWKYTIMNLLTISTMRYMNTVKKRAFTDAPDAFVEMPGILSATSMQYEHRPYPVISHWLCPPVPSKKMKIVISCATIHWTEKNFLMNGT